MRVMIGVVNRGGELVLVIIREKKKSTAGAVIVGSWHPSNPGGVP